MLSITGILVCSAAFCLFMHILCFFSTKANDFDGGYWAGATVALCLSAALVGLLT